MFSKDITGSDAFRDMPTSSQNLYFHLGMEADDDGFLGNYKALMRGVGSTDDDLKILLTKRFLLLFKSGVIVVKHWLINNTVRSDRYNETKYLEEKKSLYIKENKGYTEVATNGIPLGNPVEDRKGKKSIGETKVSQAIEVKDEPEKPREKKDTSYLKVFELWGKYPLNWRKNRTEIFAAKNILVEHGLINASKALKFALDNSLDEMCPKVLKPSDLDRKWVNLQLYRDKQK